MKTAKLLPPVRPKPIHWPLPEIDAPTWFPLCNPEYGPSYETTNEPSEVTCPECIAIGRSFGVKAK